MAKRKHKRINVRRSCATDKGLLVVAREHYTDRTMMPVVVTAGAFDKVKAERVATGASVDALYDAALTMLAGRTRLPRETFNRARCVKGKFPTGQPSPRLDDAAVRTMDRIGRRHGLSRADVLRAATDLIVSGSVRPAK